MRVRDIGVCALVLFTALESCLQVAIAESPAEQTTTRGQSRSVFGYDLLPDFRAFDSQYDRKHAEQAKRTAALQVRLFEQGKRGRQTPLSRQVFLELRWLTYHTALWDKIDERARTLQALLDQPADPPGAEEQNPQDGSFDHGSHAWFLKLDSSCEQIEELAAHGKKPALPLKFLDRINTPEKLTAYLDSVLVSHVRETGEDKSYELNIAVTGLERLILGDIPTDYPFHPRLRQALLDYEDHRWQDPQTGYFGGWFKAADGQIRKTADLSITFHILSYRDRDLRLWPQIARTTLAMKDYEFPYGWLEEGRYSNHHNFDVVRIFRLAWPQLDESQRNQVRAEIPKMIDFCLSQTLNPDGSFKLMDEDTIGSSFSLPVHFLNEAGYFQKRRRFWRKEVFPNAHATAQKIASRIRALGLTDPESQKTLRLLEQAD